MIRKSSVVVGVGALCFAAAGCGESKPAKDPFAPADPTPSATAAGSSSASAGKPASTGASTENAGSGGAGDTAPTFSLDSLNNAGKLSIEKGKVTIVDFWATWCEPCKKSFPKLQELHVKHRSSGLNIVAISVDDDKKDIPAFAKRFSAKFPVGWDSDHTLVAKYFGQTKDPTMPTSFVVDKHGKIRFRHIGYHPGEEDELEKEFKQLIAEK